jgi:hypothetical protein
LDRALRRLVGENPSTLDNAPHRVKVFRLSYIPTHLRIVSTCVAAALLVSAPPAVDSAQKTAKLPAGLENYLATVVKPTPGERAKLMDGAPLTRLLDADVTKETAAFGAIWIDAPVRRYVDAVKDIERFERGGRFKVTRRINSPPRLEDFADMHLTSEDVDDLRTCRIGDCELKLSQQALQAFRTEVDWKAANPQASADAVMRRLSYNLVTGYLEKGNDQLAVYRDNSRPTLVASEFRSLVDQMPTLTPSIPELRRYLLGYPATPLPGATSFVYWQETTFGLKPTIRISHLVIWEGKDETLVASKMLYASHYFWTALELRALFPDPSRGRGFWLVTINRSRSDGLSGFTGFFIRRRVRSEVQAGTLSILNGTKERLETSN